MIDGFGFRPRTMLSDNCDEVVDEYYESVEGNLGYVIIHTVVYNCGREHQMMIPDVRRNLESQLDEAVENEEYELATKIKNHIDSLNNPYKNSNDF